MSLPRPLTATDAPLPLADAPYPLLNVFAAIFLDLVTAGAFVGGLFLAFFCSF